MSDDFIALPRLTRTQIICGDCGGFEALPKKTLLTISGRCASCGGRSFVLAATLAPVIASSLRRQREIKEYTDLSTDIRRADHREV